MIKGIRMRMQTFVLILLIPSLLVVTCSTGYYIYNSLHKVILLGFDKKLFSVSTVTAAFIDGTVHQQILAAGRAEIAGPDGDDHQVENSHLYLQYVAPMRNILNKAQCKYVYSQIVGPTSDPTQDVVYILDATIGSEHSHIADLDHLPDDEKKGGNDVQEGKAPYVISDMRFWTEWGYLKSCFVPIYDEAGRIVAMTGTDIDVNIIFSKTNVMLEEVGFAALACILLGVMLSLQIARRITEPISLVKNGALMVAAGRYGHKITVDGPQELSDLAASFNKLSADLTSTIAELNRTNKDLEQRRSSEELKAYLAEAIEPSFAGTNVAAGLIGHKDGLVNCSGFTVSRDCRSIVLWAASGKNEPLQSAHLRAKIQEIGERLLNRYCETPNEVGPRLLSAYPDAIASVVVFDVPRSTVHGSGIAMSAIVLGGLAGGQSVEIPVGGSYTVPAGHKLVVATTDLAPYNARLSDAQTSGPSELLASLAGMTSGIETEEAAVVLEGATQ